MKTIMFKSNLRQALKVILCLASTVGLASILIACNSSGTGTDSSIDTSDIFVSDDDSAGSLSISLGNSSITIANTGNFSVSLRDVNGAPVSGVRISCDTEAGLALIEPNTGVFLTDSFGNASGVIGCEGPGSFQIGCRAPLGFGRRIFATVKCSGEAPIGFTGFDGAGGGGLGGGVADDGSDTGTDFDVRLTGISFFDDGTTSGTTSIDVVQDICEVQDDGDIIYEPFFDTTVQFTVENNSTEIIRFTSYRYRVFNFDLNGNTHTSPRLNFIGEASAVAGGGGTGTFTALFADADSGGKTFFNRTSTIGQQGFLNIEVTLFGTTSAGESMSISARTALSFDNFNRCS